MDASRLKNIMIGVLLAANLALAALVGVRAYSDYRTERAAADDAVAALAELGMEVERELLLSDGGALYISEVERSLDGERALAERLIGASVQSRDGSGIYTLTGERGSARLANAGRITVEPDEPLDCADLGALLELCGLSAEDFSLEGGAARQLIGGAPVFNVALEPEIEGGKLMSLGGGVLLGEVYATDGAPSKSLAAALLALAARLGDAGEPAGRVLSAELGWRAELTAPGYTRLEPVWAIDTENAGAFYVDAMTLEISRR